MYYCEMTINLRKINAAETILQLKNTLIKENFLNMNMFLGWGQSEIFNPDMRNKLKEQIFTLMTSSLC